MNKAAIINRIDKLGLRTVAEALMSELRAKHKAAGDDRAVGNAAAWDGMWEEFKPTVEKMENEKEKESDVPQPAPTLRGLPADLDSVLDRKYDETNPGRQLRDGLLWAAMEWMRVIRDGDDGPAAKLSAATTPPPNAFALFVLSTYALSPIEKRRDLISRAMAFAAKPRAHAPSAGGDNGDEPDEEEGGFLGEIGGE